MARLRILSWNLRTFATHEPRDVDLAKIVDIMLASNADIVLVQELQIGRDVGSSVDANVSDRSAIIIEDLLLALHMRDRDAGWWWSVSGADKGRARTKSAMRDAHAMFVKGAPVKSHFKTVEPVDFIAD